MKPLDKYKLSLGLLYGFAFVLMVIIIGSLHDEKEKSLEQLQRENMLKAMRKTYKKVDYDLETEITGAEQVEMNTKQYKKVVEQQRKKE